MIVSRMLFLGAASFFFPFSFLSLGSSFLACGEEGAGAGGAVVGGGMAMGGGAWPGVKKVGGAWGRAGWSESFKSKSKTDGERGET